MKLKSRVPIAPVFYVSCVFFLRILTWGQLTVDDQIELPGGDNELYPTDNPPLTTPSPSTTIPTLVTLPPTSPTTTILSTPSTTLSTTPISYTTTTTTGTTNPPSVVGTCPLQCLNSISDTNYRVGNI